jgi:hypothetical protein
MASVLGLDVRFRYCAVDDVEFDSLGGEDGMVDGDACVGFEMGTCCEEAFSVQVGQEWLWGLPELPISVGGDGV